MYYPAWELISRLENAIYFCPCTDTAKIYSSSLEKNDTSERDNFTLQWYLALCGSKLKVIKVFVAQKQHVKTSEDLSDKREKTDLQQIADQTDTIVKPNISKALISKMIPSELGTYLHRYICKAWIDSPWETTTHCSLQWDMTSL